MSPLVVSSGAPKRTRFIWYVLFVATMLSGFGALTSTPERTWGRNKSTREPSESLASAPASLTNPSSPPIPFRTTKKLSNSGARSSAKAAGTAIPEDQKPAFRDGIVLAGFARDTTREQEAQILAKAGAVEMKIIGQGVHVLRVPAGKIMQVIQSLLSSPEVRYAEPDFRHSLNGAPNDPGFPQQWAFQNTGQTVNGVGGTSGADEGALRAWSVTTGSSSVVVAVVDTGIDYNHPDLAANMWSNPGGINGCAAGTHGYNVLNSSCDPMDDDTVYNGHGTHVAGIIGAVTNNGVGVAGVNWQTSLMGVKWVDAAGSGYTSDLISALDWVIQAKQAGINVRVINDSQTWPGTAASQALSDEIDALGSNDILFVTAAGNTAQNNDTTPRYPCVYDQPNQICVAASNQNDQLWSSSNYGAGTVDLAAPGVNILSTLRNGAYGLISGCSMSAAEVSGAAALVLSTGYQSVTSLKATLLSGVDLLPAFTSTTRTGGRLNICKAIRGCAAYPPLAITTTSLPNGAVGRAYSTTLSASGGTPPYTWTESGSLPPGLALSTNGTLSGTPTTAGTWNFVAQVTDTHSASATQALSISVNSPSAAAITLVQAASGQASGVPSISQTFPSANTPGNLIIAFVRMSSTSQTVGVTDSAGNLYTDAVAQVQTSDAHQVHIFYAKNILGGANTVTANFSSTNNHPWLAIFEYSGLSTTSPLDRTSSAQGSGTAVSTGTTAQTRASGELLFSGLGVPSSSTVTITAGSGYVLEQSDPTSPGSRAATEQGFVSSIGAFSATYSLSGSANWSAVLATFSATAIN
jgi:subtilisin family serine protease